MRTWICSASAPEEECRQLVETLRTLIPDADLQYVVDADGQRGFEATVALDADRQGLATLIVDMLRPKSAADRARRGW